jgi:Cytochrome B561
MPVPARYSRLQIALHWTIAVLILVQLTVNADMQRAFAHRLSSGTLPSDFGAWFHAAIGILALALAVARLFVRSNRGVPSPPKGTHPLLNALSHGTHMLLYGFMFFMPITGAVAWFTGLELSAVFHELGRLVLIPVILLHIGGAIVEEVVLDNRVLRRMTHPEAPD